MNKLRICSAKGRLAQAGRLLLIGTICTVSFAARAFGADEADFKSAISSTVPLSPPTTPPSIFPYPADWKDPRYVATQLYIYSSDPAGLPAGDPCFGIYTNDGDPAINGVYEFCIKVDYAQVGGGSAPSVSFYSPKASQINRPLLAAGIKSARAAQAMPDEAWTALIRYLAKTGNQVSSNFLSDEHSSKWAYIGGSSLDRGEAVLMTGGPGWLERLLDGAAAVGNAIGRILKKTPKDPELLPFRPRSQDLPKVVDFRRSGIHFGAWLNELGVCTKKVTFTKGITTRTAAYHYGVPYTGQVVDLTNVDDEGLQLAVMNGLFELHEAVCEGFTWVR